MIKFFRNFRRRLLKQNRFTSYLIYAVGEIVLVVIGILIALQINNWNEERKARQRLQLVLTNLREEIKVDSIYLSNVFQMENDLLLSSAQRLFEAHSGSNMVEENDSLTGMAFRFATFTPVIKASKNAYNELVSSDLFNLIQSKELGADLKRYYNQIEFLQRYSDNNSQFTGDLGRELTDYYIIESDTTVNRGQLSGFAGAVEEHFYSTYNLKGFRSNSSLNPKLYDMIDIHKDRLGGLKIIGELSQKIQQQVNQELKIDPDD